MCAEQKGLNSSTDDTVSVRTDAVRKLWSSWQVCVLPAQGSLSFMLFDEILGYLLLFRCPGSSMPLYWGTDADANDVLLLSTREARGVAQFPPGCAYEVSMLAASHENYCKHTTIAAHTEASDLLMRAIDSPGQACSCRSASRAANACVHHCSTTPVWVLFYIGHLNPDVQCTQSRLLEADPQGWSRLLNVTRHSPAARAVNSLPVVNSHGALCGMMFKSVSGRDLTQATVELDREVF